LLNTLGARISFCRGMLGLTREKFIENFGIITLSTLARWELNTINIPESKLCLLYNFFLKNGLLLKLEWLRYGEGMPPINVSKTNLNTLNFDEITYTILSLVRKKLNNFKFYQINNTLYEPIIKFGDYIGGIEILENFISLHNKFCYLKLNNEILIGIFNYECSTLIYNNNVTNIYILDIICGGEIIWITRRP
jgi:transcriptional regulator with XRE-family HTH domain